MRILSTVCAEFKDENGVVVHRVDGKNRNKNHKAPEVIRRDPLFAMLERDGSLEAVFTEEDARKLDKIDPEAGVDASGKRLLRDPETIDPAGDAKASGKKLIQKPEMLDFPDEAEASGKKLAQKTETPDPADEAETTGKKAVRKNAGASGEKPTASTEKDQKR